MPRELSTPLPQPIFNEGQITLDPKRFKIKHPSDNQQYKEVEKLLTKDVVPFVQSRVQPSDVYTLESALGPHGPESIQAIKQAGKTVFHCAGDTGASSEGKYGDELRVSDQVTEDCRTSAVADRAAFFYQPVPKAGGTGGDHASSPKYASAGRYDLQGAGGVSARGAFGARA